MSWPETRGNLGTCKFREIPGDFANFRTILYTGKGVVEAKSLNVVPKRFLETGERFVRGFAFTVGRDDAELSRAPSGLNL